MKNSNKAHLYIILANIIYGLNYVIAKISLTEIPPLGMVVTRVFFSLCILCTLRLFIKFDKIDKSDHLKLIICAFFGVACNQLLFFKGLSLTSEIHASLIMITTPILVLMMSWIILKEKITSNKIAGIILGAVGVFYLIITSTGFEISSGSVTGDICIMLNAASYAIFLVLAKPLMIKYSPFTLMFWIFFYGLFMVIPFGFSEVISVSWLHLSSQVYYAWIYVIIGATFFAYLFNTLGLNYGNPTLVSVYIYTQPIIATIVSLVLKTDSITLNKVIAALFIFLGVAMVSIVKGDKSRHKVR